jgi:fatty-acid peroxygenase
VRWISHRPRDSTTSFLREGYLWLPERRRQTLGAPVSTRLGGMRVTGLSGAKALDFFYDEANIQRAGAIPHPILSTLFGHGAVHTLDGPAHRRRKTMLLSLMSPAAAADLAARATRLWDEAAESWPQQPRIVLFDESSRILTRAVCQWAGVPVPDHDINSLANDLVALVDGFGTAGARHWRARAARRRREAWLARLVEDVRSGSVPAPEGSALDVISTHRELDGAVLEPRVAAVELLNVLRPTVAVCWFVTYAAHALHQWPQNRDRLRDGGPGFATAFTHEVRRFYPFAPFVGGRAVRELQWQGEVIPAGSTVLADLYGQNHDDQVWPEPYRFAPERFLDRPIGEFELVPQGGGDPALGHRCPGEKITIGLLESLCQRLAALSYTVPPQNLHIPANRIPARVRSGMVITEVQPPSPL